MLNYNSKEHEIMEKLNQEDDVNGFGVILLIEDDDIVMDVGRAMIEKLRYTVLQARTGKAAIEYARSHAGAIDLAMLDMDIPDMKGDEILPYLVAARPRMKIVVCSGEYPGSKLSSLLETGVHDFLQKPFSFKTLETMLVKHVDRRNAARIMTTEDFLAVSDQKGVYSIRIIDISQGGLSFSSDGSKSNEEDLVDVAVLMAEKGVNLDDMECRIVSEKKMNSQDIEAEGLLKRKSVSFGRMTKQQFEKLSELIQACSKKE
ncbi:MAG: response regulator [Proteobacteria bacterium]|nr:response regulator [Pseudomonadota bacterium]